MGSEQDERKNTFMTIKDSRSKAVAVSAACQVSDLGALLDAHIAREFADLDVDATQKENRSRGVRFPLPAR